MHFYFIIFGLISAATLSFSRIINTAELNSIDQDINMKLDMQKKNTKSSTQHKKRGIRLNTILHADQPAHVTVDEGSAFTLRCTAFGSPRIAINWIPERQASEEIAAVVKNSQVNRYSRLYEFMMLNSTYTVDCATLEDAGKMNCVGFANGLLSIRTIEITVNPIPIEERQCYLPGEPVITEFVSSFFGSIGSELIVSCKIYSNSRPLRISWQTNKNTSVERWNENYEIMSDGSLKIKKLLWGDMGEWTCQATTPRTRLEAKTFIYPLLTN